MAPGKEVVLSPTATKPLPVFSPAVKCDKMVYCSGSIELDPSTEKFVSGTVKDRTVRQL